MLQIFKYKTEYYDKSLLIHIHRFYHTSFVRMSLDAQFNASADQIRKFSKRPPDTDMLEIYALFKQATVGDINTPKPSDQVALSKWNAWGNRKGLASNKAKEQYIAKVKELSPRYA